MNDFAKSNPNHDARGRFASADGGGAEAKGAGSRETAGEFHQRNVSGFKHELELVATSAAITAAVALTIAMAPKWAAGKVAGWVLDQAKGAATGMLRGAALSAGLNIAQNAGIDMTAAQHVINAVSSVLKAAPDASVARAMAPHFEDLGERACAALKAEMQARNPDKPMSEVDSGVDAALADYKSGLAGMMKVAVEATAAPLFKSAAAGAEDDRAAFRRMAGEMSVIADGFGGALAKAHDGALRKSISKSEAKAREIAERMTRLASAPIPLALMPVVGTA